MTTDVRATGERATHGHAAHGHAGDEHGVAGSRGAGAGGAGAREPGARPSARPGAMRPAFPGTRVLLVGGFDGPLQAHATLRRRALERLGCHVTPFDPSGEGGWLRRWRAGAARDRLARALAASAADVVLVLEHRQVEPAAVAALRGKGGATWVAWLCDGLVDAQTLAEAAAAYDIVLAGKAGVAGELPPATLAHLRYLAPACDPSVHRPHRSRDLFRANVVFAGTATPYRERLLGELVEFGLAVWGPGWRRTRLRDYCRGELLDHADYVRACAGGSVAVNVPCVEDVGATGERGCNRRLFELAGIGVVQVTADGPDLHRHFREGTEVLVYRDPGELRSLAREALQDRGWGEGVAAAARRRALTEHTYVHRLTGLLEATRGQAARGAG